MDRRAAGVRVGLLLDASAREATPAGLDGRVLSLVYEDTEAKADKLTLELDNRDMTLFDREDLLGGALLEVSWGYRGAMAAPRRVVVQKMKGFEVLTLEGHALSVLLHRQERTRRFEHQRASDVAMAIAREHGFADAWIVIEPTTRVHDVLNQAAETDAALLRRLASREGYAFFVDDTGFHFHSENLQPAPTHVLGWRTTSDVPVTSIRVENDVMRRVGKVSVRGRDPLTRSTREGTANSDTTPRTTLGEGVAVVDPETGALAMEVRNASEAVRSESTGDAQGEANNRFKKAERPTVKLTLETLGEPTLRAKALVEVRGIPPLLSGKYYVTEVRHTVNGEGYVCSLKVVRDALGRRAASTLRRQGGDPNRAQKKADGALTPVLIIDPETGRMRREYRRDGRALGGEDPEARLSHEVSEPSEPLMSGSPELMSVSE
jgi:phage protein D